MNERSETTPAIAQNATTKIVPVIPTCSIVQLWEKIQDKLDLQVLELKVRKQSQGSRLELTPYMYLNRRPTSEELFVCYKKKLHGEETLGNMCYKIEREGFLDAFISKLSFSDNKNVYTFTNVPAPVGMEGYVKAIRAKFLKQHGMDPMPQLMMLRVLKLTDAKPKMWWTAKEKAVLQAMRNLGSFTDDILTTLKREYGALFCKVTEIETQGKVIRMEINAKEIEETSWW